MPLWPDLCKHLSLKPVWWSFCLVHILCHVSRKDLQYASKITCVLVPVNEHCHVVQKKNMSHVSKLLLKTLKCKTAPGLNIFHSDPGFLSFLKIMHVVYYWSQKHNHLTREASADIDTLQKSLQVHVVVVHVTCTCSKYSNAKYPISRVVKKFIMDVKCLWWWEHGMSPDITSDEFIPPHPKWPKLSPSQ